MLQNILEMDLKNILTLPYILVHPKIYFQKYVTLLFGTSQDIFSKIWDICEDLHNTIEIARVR